MNKKIPDISPKEYGYEGTISLAAWDGFLSNKSGIYYLDIGGDMVSQDPISDEHLATYQYIIENQFAIKDILLEELFKDYKNLQESYGYEDNEAEELMPNILNVNDLKSLIGLSSVHLMNVYNDGFAYAGFEFICKWDEEHGFGVMMYKDEVVALGGADASILTWIAEEHLKENS